jgi:hypothetical protein
MLLLIASIVRQAIVPTLTEFIRRCCRQSYRCCVQFFPGKACLVGVPLR